MAFAVRFPDPEAAMASDPVPEWSGYIRISGVPIMVHRMPDGTRVIDADDRARLVHLWSNSSSRLSEVEWDALFRFGSRADTNAAI